MEIKAELKQPYTENERLNFIVEQNHKLGYTIEEADSALLAWGKSDEEILEQARFEKQAENTAKAKQAVEDGHVLYKGAEFETNAQTVGDLTATMLLMQASGVQTYTWLSKDDIAVDLTPEDFGILGALIADYKNRIWNERYLNFKTKIEKATTVSALNNINISYDTAYVTLTVQATPAEAKVTINDVERTQETQMIFVGSKATFNYKVECEGYITVEGTEKIKADKALEITLEEEPKPEPEKPTTDENTEEKPTTDENTEEVV